MPQQTSRREPHELYPNEAGQKAPAEGAREPAKKTERPPVNQDAEKRPERTEN